MGEKNGLNNSQKLLQKVPSLNFDEYINKVPKIKGMTRSTSNVKSKHMFKNKDITYENED